MSYTFRFLDDIALADVAFEAEGDSVEEVFRGATRALIETLADPLTVAVLWERAITKSDGDLAALLFEWLSEIVYWKDAAGVVFHDASLALIEQNGSWTLHGRFAGSPVDQTVQALRNDVKGITKHQYELKRDDACWRVRVVLDV